MTNTFLTVALMALVAVAALRPQTPLEDGRPRSLRIVAFILMLIGVIASE